MRCLRDYEGVAQVDHFCDNCCSYIHPGDSYRASVMLDEDKHRIVVFKSHHYPGCPPEELEEEAKRARASAEASRREEASVARKAA